MHASCWTRFIFEGLKIKEHLEQFDIKNEGLIYSLPFDGKHRRYFYDCDMDETIPESGRCEAPLHVLKQSLMFSPTTLVSGVWFVDKKSGFVIRCV